MLKITKSSFSTKNLRIFRTKIPVQKSNNSGNLLIPKTFFCPSFSFFSSSSYSLLNFKTLNGPIFASSWQCNFFVKKKFGSASLSPQMKVALPALFPTMEKDLLVELGNYKAIKGFKSPEKGYLTKISEETKDIPLNKLLSKSDVKSFKSFSFSKSNSSLFSSSFSSSSFFSSSSSFSTSSSFSSSSSGYPKHTKVLLPCLSPSMDKGGVQDWLVGEGEELKEGDLLAQIETDKASMDFESPEDGFLAKILQKAGSKDLNIGTPLCIIVEKKEDINAFENYKEDPSQATTPSSSSPPPPPTPSSSSSPPPPPTSYFSPPPPIQTPPPSSFSSPPIGEENYKGATPLAKKLAKEKGINIMQIKGTGHFGAVTADDVNNFSPSAPPSLSVSPSPSPSLSPSPSPPSPSVSVPLQRSEDSYVDIPLSNMRQVIATRLLESKSTIPHYYLSIDINMDNIIKFRKELNNMLMSENIKLSVNDFIIKASALSCKKIPEANSSWGGTFIRQNNKIDINVAVATDSGLITPIVFDADKKGLASISSDVTTLAEKAKQGKLKPNEFQGGTFTVSNLGMYGIKVFSAIINPPQACILAIGSSELRLLPDPKAKHGHKSSQVMSVTLSCDHRVVDGAVGAQWLQNFKKLMENPDYMLL